MGNGWIKLHRKLLDNPIFKNERYLKLWIYLLLRANHKPDKIMWNDGVIDITGGQFVTGRKKIAEDTGLKETTIEDILNYLEKQHQIRQQKNTKFRVITLLKWDEYQNPDTKSDNKATTKRQQSDTNKKGNKVKNDKNFILFWDKYPRKTAKQKAIESWLKLNPSGELVSHILAAIELQKQSPQWQKDGGQFIPHPATWLNQRRWEDEIIKNSGKVDKF